MGNDIYSGFIPSSFLPHLPRSQLDFDHISPQDLLSNISVLRELYIPPVHGGFGVAELNDEQDRTEKKRKRERRFSAGLSDTMGGLGLGLDVAAHTGPSSSTQSSVPPALENLIEEEEYSDDMSDEDSTSEAGSDDEIEEPHLDPFERDWSEKWLSGVVRRAQNWLEANLPDEDDPSPQPSIMQNIKEIEAVLRDATAALAMMAGTSSAGSFTRHLVFPIHPSLEAGLRSLRPALLANPSHSPQTNKFLAALSISPSSPVTSFLRGRSPDMSTAPSSSQSQRPSELSASPTNSTFSAGTSTSFSQSQYRSRRRKRKRQPVVPILLHDAPMKDHLSVGVQTWGSAILLGRRMALDPNSFGLFESSLGRGVRVLELGAGTGLLSILCRKLLDLHQASKDERDHIDGDATVPASPRARSRRLDSDGLVVSTDFLPEVLENLKVCVDLNFPSNISDTSIIESSTDTSERSGIHIAKLDWKSFPHHMMAMKSGLKRTSDNDDDECDKFMDEPFDLVLASDCVYDPTHAEMLRAVASWVVRLPDPDVEGDQGGTFHILSPIRPTFTPELESIDVNFPLLSSYAPLKDRQAASSRKNGYLITDEMTGEGLGLDRGLRLGVRGQGKKSATGRKGEGRTDEAGGYWWWEVGWG